MSDSTVVKVRFAGKRKVELVDDVTPDKINDGDKLEIDYEAGVIRNKTTGVDISFQPLPDFALEIINDGGLLEHITKKQN